MCRESNIYRYGTIVLRNTMRREATYSPLIPRSSLSQMMVRSWLTASKLFESFWETSHLVRFHRYRKRHFRSKNEGQKYTWKLQTMPVLWEKTWQQTCLHSSYRGKTLFLEKETVHDRTYKKIFSSAVLKSEQKSCYCRKFIPSRFSSITSWKTRCSRKHVDFIKMRNMYDFLFWQYSAQFEVDKVIFVETYFGFLHIMHLKTNLSKTDIPVFSVRQQNSLRGQIKFHCSSNKPEHTIIYDVSNTYFRT